MQLNIRQIYFNSQIMSLAYEGSSFEICMGDLGLHVQTQSMMAC